MLAPALPIIRTQDVGVQKRGRVVLSDITLAFDAGAKYTIVGPSGAGKTTLLRLLNRLDDPTSGALWFHGNAYAHLSPMMLRRRVAMVFQVPVMFPGTVRSNLSTALRFQNNAGAVSPDLTSALESAGLNAGMLERDAAALSIGEKQRVCLARALMTHPEVLLLDEPTAALDPTAAHRLIQSIVDLSQGGLTVIMVSHQPEQARVFGGEVILLVGGCIAEQASAAQFFNAPATAEGRSYLERNLPGAPS